MAMQEYLICPRKTSQCSMDTIIRDPARRRLPEILAPAGSREALDAAVAAGADAVYLGGPRFGARHFAENFSEDDIREAVRYAHIQGVKIYVTVNTLIQDTELPDAISYLLSLYRMGVDSVLVQDIGLFWLSRECIPGLPLHASTQCTISSREGARWARKTGFSRVVMARETPLSEIDRILRDPGLERPGIEIFVHGALCYSYSGQCLLSSVIGGRSGNRGMCAQPCRKSYRLVQGLPDDYGRLAGLQEVPCEGRYLLSTRDLCVYPSLDEIVKRGVDSLKIEGRMRSPEYVRTVVGAYRRALDALLEVKTWYSSRDVEDMALAFSRGFTRGYLFGECGQALMGRDQPGNRGLMLGLVAGSRGKKGGVRVRPAAGYVPVAGDGILITDPSGRDLVGYALNRNAESSGSDLILPGAPVDIPPGSRVYVTKSMLLSRDKRGSPRSIPDAVRIPARIKVCITTGEPIQGRASCTGREGKAVSVQCTIPFIPEQAVKGPASRKDIIRQVQKSGNTPFQVVEVDLACQGDPFVPLGELNRLRRDLLTALESAWLQASLPDDGEIEASVSRVRRFIDEYTHWLIHKERSGKRERAPEIGVYCGTPEELTAACDAGCENICYEPEEAGWTECLQELVEASRYCREYGSTFTWKWPRITGGEFLERALRHVHDLYCAGICRIMVEELGMAEAILGREPRMVVLGGAGLNIYNARAAFALSPHLSGITLSPELSSDRIGTLVALSDRMMPGIRYEVICQGNLEVMVSKDRLLSVLAPQHMVTRSTQFGIQDETGHIFPVYEDSVGRTHVLNAVETTLIDRIPFLAEAGISCLAIDARRRGPRYAHDMTALYMDGIGALLQGLDDTDTWTCFKSRARMMARGGITHGHFERGVPGFS